MRAQLATCLSHHLNAYSCAYVRILYRWPHFQFWAGICGIVAPWCADGVYLHWKSNCRRVIHLVNIFTVYLFNSCCNHFRFFIHLHHCHEFPKTTIKPPKPAICCLCIVLIYTQPIDYLGQANCIDACMHACIRRTWIDRFTHCSTKYVSATESIITLHHGKLSLYRNMRYEKVIISKSKCKLSTANGNKFENFKV